MLARSPERNGEVMPIVKSNAYGHGLDLVVRALLDEEVRWLGVNTLDEGIEARALAPGARVLVMGYVDPVRFEEALAARLDLTLTNPEDVPLLDACAAARSSTARVHVKVETGTHRRGLVTSEHHAIARAAREARRVEWVGLATHFANIEDTINHAYADAQLVRYHETKAALAELGLRFSMHHVACTAAALLFPATHMDLARVGIGL
jgi:alanine racemase